jgi:hypothetical protein
MDSLGGEQDAGQARIIRQVILSRVRVDAPITGPKQHICEGEAFRMNMSKSLIGEHRKCAFANPFGSISPPKNSFRSDTLKDINK